MGKKDERDQGLEKATLATSLSLLAITKIAEAFQETLSECRADLVQKLTMHPERPELNVAMVRIPSRGKNPFQHWIKPWKVAALALQPNVDKSYLIDLTRDLFKHFDKIEYTISPKKSQPALWAAGHFLYATRNVIANLKNYYTT